jgi:arylsulfatase
MSRRVTPAAALVAVGALGWLVASGRVTGSFAQNPQPKPAGLAPAVDGSVLPFPPTPSASTAGLTIQDSVHQKRVEPRRLAADAPNVLVILIDDVGPGTPSTYGGEVNTPTLSRVAKMGVSYNRFHSTAMCSPTRAALLTGRNHTRVCNGQITELANDFDGFSGTIPKTSATAAEVLKNYGYNTAAFGKWHNTPATHITTKGPFDYWPTGYGFEYFYGFLAGETGQYEPRLIKNTTEVPPPKTPEQGYHLTEDLADNAVTWLREQQAFAPDKPFFMYWATGAAHGPHHVMKEWADKYQGKFDDGWDQYRERAFARQKELGWIPKDAKLTPRPDTLPAWDSIPEAERPFQRRLMEVWAGFAEHADHNAGKLLDELDRQGKLDNTLVFYVWGDNGSSAEGQNGTISELLAHNQIPTTTKQQLEALDKLGGLPALGSPKTDNHHHAGWAWAGSTPYKGTKLVAAHFGGTRQPMAVSWPKTIKPDAAPRPQFHHVIDVVPTVYEAVGITPPKLVNGVPQDEFDGVSMAYSFNDPKAKGTRRTQFFDIMGSRGVYHDGWYACTFGPRVPWLTVTPGLDKWTPDKDKWELYDLDADWTQADDLAAKMPDKVAAMKELFTVESVKNKNLPIGGGLYVTYHPDQIVNTGLSEWTFAPGVGRMPEFTAPRVGSFSNLVTVKAEFPENADGVLFALGGYNGGLTCYLKGGELAYEYNLFHVERTVIKAKDKLAAGKHTVEVELKRKPAVTEFKHLASADVVVRVDGKEVATGTVPRLISFGFTTNGCLDFGSDLGSPVSDAYHDKAPFPFTGKFLGATVKYVK